MKAGCVIAVLLSTASVAAAQHRPSPRPLLEVPYMAQTPALCGGAAVAMVSRYWGTTDVFPQDFASLVVAGSNGIATTVLVDAARARGWRADLLAVTDETAHRRLGQDLDQGRPLIALIEIAPGTFHYVVVVGLTASQVVFHDPARAPYSVVSWGEFDRAWSRAQRWALRLLPPATSDVPMRVVEAPPVDTPTACTRLVAQGVALAQAGASEDAGRVLTTATEVCPLEASAWRELAGWHFANGHFAEAGSLSTTAVELDPADVYARDLLGTSRFMTGDTRGALAAWAPIGRPRADAIAVTGLVRTPHPVVVAATGVEPRQILTPQAFERAQRRVQALPSLAASRVAIMPLDDDRASLAVAVVERPMAPTAWRAIPRIATRALVQDTLAFTIAGALHRGEALRVAWRWSERQSGVAGSLDIPWAGGARGVTTLTASGETLSLPGGARASERRLLLAWSDWLTHQVWWRSGIGLDRFDGRRHLSLTSAADVRVVRDLVAIGGALTGWSPAGGLPHVFTARLSLAARRRTTRDDVGWFVWQSIDVATAHAPRSLWAGARQDEVHAHTVPAERLFGRGLSVSTLEHRRPVGRWHAHRVGAAVFLQFATAWRTPTATGHTLVRAGLGITLHGPGLGEGLRLDLIREGAGVRPRVMVSWHRVWPQ